MKKSGLMRFLVPSLAALLAAPLFAADSYTFDGAHTYPVFEVRHLNFSTQRGRFNKTSGKLVLDIKAKSGAHISDEAPLKIELKSVTASVYFSSDVANPDTYTKFYTDLEMYTTTMTQPDPALHMLQFVSWEAASKDNKWQGRNITRWQSPECDKLYRESESELDAVKRAALFIKMNDLAIQNHIVLGIVQRPTVSALGTKLNAQISGWDNNTSDLSNWYKEA